MPASYLLDVWLHRVNTLLLTESVPVRSTDDVISEPSSVLLSVGFPGEPVVERGQSY